MIEIYNFKVNFIKKSLFIPELKFDKKGLYLIIGENGCGKTTFIRSILNIFKDYEGKILIDGNENKKLSRKEIASKISYLPQEELTAFSLKVKDFINTGLYSVKENIFETIVDFLDLKSYLELEYNSLSGGERQLVRIARSLVAKVDYSLLDEPDTYLSRKNQERMLELFSHISKERSIVAISHSKNHFSRFKNIDFEQYVKEN